MGEYVKVETDGDGVATIRLDRPPVNALNPQMWDELGEAARTCRDDDEVLSVVLYGGPKIFAAGADIKAMKDMSFQGMSQLAGSLQDAFSEIARLPKVVIAAITGYALGGGCELALTADFRYAADNVQMGQPEILLGVIPGAGGTQRLQRLVGIQQARRMVFDGTQHTADECLRMGLVDKVCGPDEVYDAARKAARRYARGPYALRLAKQAINEGSELDLDAALRLESQLFAACFATEDQTTGMEAFLEEGPGQAEFEQR